MIKGALVSILGKEFGMHPHRAVHLSKPGKKEQLWHRVRNKKPFNLTLKDSFWGYRLPLRYPLPWMVMAMYYPQKTTLQMGPTGIKPGTQYYTLGPKFYDGSLPNHFKDVEFCYYFFELKFIERSIE